MNKAAIERLIDQLERTIPGWTSLPMGERVRRLVARARHLDERKLQMAVRLLMERHNSAARSEFGGLSPSQVNDLLQGDWSHDTPGVQLNLELPPAVVADTPIMRRAAAFLTALAPDGTPITATGNLNRKFVAEVLPSLGLSERFMADLHHHNKVINEPDAYPLHLLRIQLALAKLIRVYRKRFVVTPLGRRLQAPDQLPALYALLFRTVFRDFNLGYSDGIPEVPEFQHCLGYSLYHLTHMGDTWQDFEASCAVLMIPALQAKLPPSPGRDVGRSLVKIRLLKPLELFGLVELKWQQPGGRPNWYPDLVAWRRTELAAQFLQFRWTGQ